MIMMEEKTEVKEGFKQAKIGWIPYDWKMSKIGSISDVYAGGTPSTRNQKYWNGDIRWMSSGDLNLKKIKEVSGRITPEGLNNSSTRMLPIGCVLIGLAGQGKTRGTIAMNYVELCTNQSVAAILPSNNINMSYLYYNLDNRYDEIRRLSTGDGGRGGLNLKIIKNIKITLPPLPEQQKIASILSDWDEAIENTQTLIEKLELRKKGLIQQLLTGKTRFAGFSGEWSIIKAGELFENHTDKNHDGTLEVLSATQDKGVIPRSETGIDIKYNKDSLTSYKRLDVGDFVISLRSFQGGIEYSNYEGLVSPAYTVLREKKPISKLYYREYMKTQSFINKLNSMIYGIRDGKQISYKEFATMKFLYPSLEEQKAIADIIELADEEISQIKNYLEQLQSQKKGLMQQLLTGKIRIEV